MYLEHRLPGGFKAASEARQVLAQLHSKIPEDTLHSVIMLVNELVTNAVRHGMIGREDQVSLAVDVNPERVRIEVSNPGHTAKVLPRQPSMDEGSGWGLHIVESVSDRWGFEQEDGTLVWFEIALS